MGKILLFVSFFLPFQLLLLPNTFAHVYLALRKFGSNKVTINPLHTFVFFALKEVLQKACNKSYNLKILFHFLSSTTVNYKCGGSLAVLQTAEAAVLGSKSRKPLRKAWLLCTFVNSWGEKN